MRLLPTILLLTTAYCQNQISFQPDKGFRNIGAAIVDEGRLTKEVIPSNTYTDPNGYTIDFHLLKYDQSRRTADEVEKAYTELEFDSSNWRWNKKEVIYFFPIRLPDQQSSYNTGRRTKNTALLFARNGKGGGSVTKVRTTVNAYNLDKLKGLARLELTIKATDDDLQDTIRRMVELVTTQTQTQLKQWRVIEVNNNDDQYQVSLTFDDDINAECDTKNLATVWYKLTGQNNFDQPTTLSPKFADSAMAENVELVSIRTVYGEGCAPPPPPVPPKPSATTPTLPDEPVLISFTAGQEQTLDLTGAGDFDLFEITASDLDTDYNQFMMIDGKTIKAHPYSSGDLQTVVFMSSKPLKWAPPLTYISNSRSLDSELEHNIQVGANSVEYHLPNRSFGLTVNVDNIGEVQYQFTEGFSFDSEPSPSHTITFDIKHLGAWTYETSALALSKMSNASKAGFRWYGLDGNKMIFSIPDQYQTCTDLSDGVSWLNQLADGNLIVNNVKLIGYDTEQFDINDNIESTCVKATTPDTTTTTSTTTSTTTTTTTTTTTSTTRKTPPPRPKCQAVFNSKRKSATIEPKYNDRQAYDVKDLYQQAYGRKKLNGSAKLEIVSVEPETTGITRYENGELIIFATDSAIQTRLALISGTPNKGVVVTVTIANRASNCESDTSEIKLEIIPQKRAAVKGCDLSNTRTHNHEFEVIMKKSQSHISPTINDEYEIMKIIRDTYNDANMEHIYMVTFVETKDQQDVINGYKMVWGNATEYNCESQCPRDQVHALTSKLVSQKPGDASKTWIVEQNFHAKFKDANFDLTTVSARGIHACQSRSDEEGAAPVSEAGVDSKVIILIVVTVGALAVIVGCCWMRQKKKADQGGQTTLGRKAKNVPVIMNDEADNENEKLVQNSRTNGLETRDETLPPKPEPPSSQSPPSIMVTKTAEIQEPTEHQ